VTLSATCADSQRFDVGSNEKTTEDAIAIACLQASFLSLNPHTETGLRCKQIWL